MAAVQTEKVVAQPSNKQLDLQRVGLSNEILQLYADRGVRHLYNWQNECIQLPGILNGKKNLVYSAPTSAGKTLVAEIVMLKRMLESRGRGLFIVPFISMAREKMLYFHEMFRNVGLEVQGYMGTVSPPGDFYSWDIAVCTIEKANGLVNKLLDEEKLSTLSVVVVDEIHLVKDGHRGQLLELLLTKIMFNKAQQRKRCSDLTAQQTTQIIGMSATLPNIELYGKWLEAVTFTTDFRPVPLEEYLFVDGIYYDVNEKMLRPLDENYRFNDDPDNVTGLCLETVLLGCGVLIFCSTKAWCERLARIIAQTIQSLLQSSGNCKVKIALYAQCYNLGKLSAKLKQLVVKERQDTFINEFATISGVVDPVLKLTLPYAVGFHHAESGFQKSCLQDEKMFKLEACLRDPIVFKKLTTGQFKVKMLLKLYKQIV